MGDTHTTRKWEPGMAEEETRFFGLKGMWVTRRVNIAGQIKRLCQK